MKKLLSLVAVAIILLVTTGISGCSGIFSQDWQSTQPDAQVERRYAITIKNLTKGQLFTPAVVIVHNQNIKLLTVGTPASAELWPIAEDGVTGPLLQLAGMLQAASNPSVFDFTTAGGISPGASTTVEVRTRGEFRFLSLAGMLASTDDGFYAISGVEVPTSGEKKIMALAYDAGSERNSETCQYVPGPPCSSHGARDTTGAEGKVQVHTGIKGIADLSVATYGWNGPVAEITIRQLP